MLGHKVGGDVAEGKTRFWANCLLPAQHKAAPEQKNCAPFAAVAPLHRINMLMKVPKIHANQLLGAFTKEARDRIMPHMTEVDLKLGTTVCEAGGLRPTPIFRKDAFCRS